MRWLAQKNLTHDIRLVRSKLDDYHVQDIAAKIEQAASRLHAGDAQAKFVAEMSRFVTPSLGKRLQDDVDFAKPWLEHAQGLLDRVQRDLVR